MPKTDTIDVERELIIKEIESNHRLPDATWRIVFSYVRKVHDNEKSQKADFIKLLKDNFPMTMLMKFWKRQFEGPAVARPIPTREELRERTLASVKEPEKKKSKGKKSGVSSKSEKAEVSE